MKNADEIKEYISLFEDSSLSVLEIEDESGAKIRMEKGRLAPPPMPPMPQMQFAPPAQAAVQTPVQPAEQSAQPKAEPAAEGKTITAPIVGVFYAAPAPGKEPFAPVGKSVRKGETVCIIEAMKCMNEIQAECDCKITEVLAKDGELVEYGRPLFAIEN